MRIAIVGTGPTGIYTLKHLLAGKSAVDVTLYEMGDRVGVGMPYSDETASRTMLANIASIEIPPVVSSYLDWMRSKSASYLKGFELKPSDLDERIFTPRLMLGDYFHEQCLQMIEAARAAGHQITVRAECCVRDVKLEGTLLQIVTNPATKAAGFDKVILATGHRFEEDDDLTDHYFPNPWSGLLNVEVPAAKVGIMGTSLSAIDAAMAVACQHGTFRRQGDDLSFETKAKGELMLTLMSWSGILPEADFYCPIPYLPLQVMTPEALALAGTSAKPFAAVYELFKAEIARADPAWAKRIGLKSLTPAAFEEAYFRDREVSDAFRWARANLAEAVANHAARKTVAWRYAILRMHEQVEELVPRFGEEELELFNASLKKVFIDNYAAVPPESIRRLLALRDAGVLNILALGDDYDMTHEEDRTVILANGKRHVFDIFIDARGQKPMTSKDVPFPSLRKALLAAGQEEPQIAEDYGLNQVPGYEDHLYMAALPYLMQDQPFVQGITASDEIGQVIAKAEARKRPRRRRAA